MLGKLLILDPKLGDLTMSRLVERAKFLCDANAARTLDKVNNNFSILEIRKRSNG